MHGAYLTAGQTLLDQGFNIFRVPFSMERMLSTESLTATLATDYLANYTGTINYITSAGGYAVVDPHNFGRFYDSIIEDTSGFQTFWQNLATVYADNSLVIFDTNNEYHDGRHWEMYARKAFEEANK